MESTIKEVYVLIVSDSTGITAERVISAALVQFEDIRPIYNKFSYVQTKEKIDEIISEAEKHDAIVIYSLVSEGLRAYFDRKKKKRQVYTIDLLGPLLKRIGRQLNVIPVSRPGLYKGLAEESLRLSESIEFTLKHDDGQNVETLYHADLIILGISRTSELARHPDKDPFPTGFLYVVCLLFDPELTICYVSAMNLDG